MTLLQKKNDPENVVNSKYYDTDQIQSLKFPVKHKSIALFHSNEWSLNKNFDDLHHLLNCTSNVFDIIVVSETRIIKQTLFTANINLTNYAIEFTPTQTSAGRMLFTLVVTCLINYTLILIFIKLTN